MKLPWKRDSRKDLRERAEKLERKLEKLESERDSWRDRYEAEDRRRSELATRKQELEKKIKRLEQIEEEDEIEEEEEREQKWKELNPLETQELLRRLRTVQSNTEILTVRSSGDIRELEDFQGLKNAAENDFLEMLYGNESFVAVDDSGLICGALKTRPFFQSGWELSNSFELEELLNFLNQEKTWVLLSGGDSKVVRESGGEVESVDEVKTRVDREHGKGGYSQKRFERKRDEQLREHLNEVRKHIGEEPLLLGNRELASEMEGRYLGGYDDNKPLASELYKFRSSRLR